MKLPFKIQLDVQNYGENRDFELLISAELISESEEIVEKSDNLITLFGKAADLGMFSGGAYSPSVSKFQIRDVNRSGAKAEYTAEVRALDANAFFILLNMLLKTHYEFNVLNNVKIQTLNSHSKPVDPANYYSLTPKYPDLFRNISFPWKIEEVNHENKDRVIEIELKQNPQKENEDIIIHGIEIWDNIMLHDGFAAGIDREEHFEGGEIYFVHPTILEHTIPWINASDAAWYALINFVERIHQNSTPVNSVTIR